MCDTSHNFWAEINKLENDKRPVPPVVDGLHDDTGIAGMFAKKYMGQVTELWLSCYLVLLSLDSKTR